MLDIINVEKTFNPGTVNEKKALNGINLHLDEGDFVTVIGGNGAGKSTMLNMIAGVYPVDCGNIVVDGIDITKLPEHKRAKYLGRVFQDPMTGTAADMQIEENLALAARRGKRRTLRVGITSKERAEYVTSGNKRLLYTAFYDGALQSTAVLTGYFTDNEDEYLPFSFEEIKIYDKLTPKCYAYLCEISRDNDSIHFDVYLLSPEGKTLVAFYGYCARKYKGLSFLIICFSLLFPLYTSLPDSALLKR